MLLRRIKYFITVVDRNSFTEAAEQCYISQSAISQQVRELERELGLELMHRANRGFTLTPAGTYFYQQGKRLLQDAEELRRETIRVGRKDDTGLRVGYLRCYGGLELQRAISAFSAQYPQTTLDVVNGNHEELYDLLRFGGVDMVLNDQRRVFSVDYVNYHLVYSSCYIELSTRSPLCLKPYLELEDIAQYPCILVSSKAQQKTEQDFYQITLGFRSSFLFAESIEEGRLMVISGKGFMPIEGLNGAHQTLNPAICHMPLHRNGTQIRRNYCAFWSKAQTNPMIEAFASLLKDEFTKECQDD